MITSRIIKYIAQLRQQSARSADMIN